MARLSVSVVVPTYNRAQLLPYTLEAIIQQSLSADEIIVVDDGSTDTTADVVGNYGNCIHYIRVQNGGDLAARNVGLRCATSDLIAFCDSDDIWRPDFLATMMQLWNVEPTLVAAYSDFVNVHDNVWGSHSKFPTAPMGFWSDLRSIGQDLAIFNHPILQRVINFQPFFQSCIVANRAKFVEMGGWDEGVGRVIGGDFATTLRFAEHAPLGVVTRPLVGIRRHSGNYSANIEAMNLGDSLVLEYVLATRLAARPFRCDIHKSIGRRRRAALDAAFARCDFTAVSAIYKLLSPEQKQVATTLKAHISRMPPSLRRIVVRAVLAIGSTKRYLIDRNH